MSTIEVDVAVVGAGAAGSSAACFIAPAASVALIDRVGVPAWRIGETLPGAARRLLSALGAWERFATAGHEAAPLKISRWGSDEAVELDAMRDPDGVGWRLDRARFEADLRADAVVRGAVALTADVRALARGSNCWRLLLDTGDVVRARRLIDASGRRSTLMRSYGQQRIVLDRLACVYQRVPRTGASDPTTYTEATRNGWWYTATLPDGDRLVAFHGDADAPAVRQVLRAGPALTALAPSGTAAAVGTIDFSRAGKARFCAANTTARSAAGEGWLAVGDGAMTLDPLSSQGLFNALATGLEAGEVTLALLAGDADATRRFAARMGDVWRAYLRHHALYYGLERRWHDAPFWARRSHTAGFSKST